MENIKVSAIIPCYNAGQYIAAMIHCFQRQTLSEWELIIVDDGSTDNTLDILYEFQKKDERIKIYTRNKEPKGPQTCRNIGLSLAKGEYVVIFDADDLISDTCLEKRVQFMEQHPDTDYASFPGKRFFDEKKLPKFNEKEPMYGVGKGTEDLLTCLLTPKYVFTVWTNIYKRSSIEGIKYLELFGSYEDFDFMVSCVLAGLKHKFSNLKEIDYFYRFRVDTNMSSMLASDQYCRSTITLFSDKLEALKERSDFLRRKKEFEKFIVLHFERIVESGNKNNLIDYLHFCQGYYSSSFVFKLHLVSKPAMLFKNKVLRKLVLYLLSGIIFTRKQSLLMFGSTLKHWK
jgi:glycosyltransferase involved in cell wall biosynthesis